MLTADSLLRMPQKGHIRFAGRKSVPVLLLQREASGVLLELTSRLSRSSLATHTQSEGGAREPRPFAPLERFTWPHSVNASANNFASESRPAPTASAPSALQVLPVQNSGSESAVRETAFSRVTRGINRSKISGGRHPILRARNPLSCSASVA